jgi:hypothetical protein
MGLFQSNDPFRDLRTNPRFTTQYLAQIEIDGEAAPLSCIMSDISGSGARLTIGADHKIPDEFTLIFRRRCRVVRRSEGQVAVQFARRSSQG